MKHESVPRRADEQPSSTFSGSSTASVAPAAAEILAKRGHAMKDGANDDNHVDSATGTAGLLPVRRKSLWDRLCLFRKHSSGDLHSRLKTRKLLGVGETDDGEIHRSKISQLLGHSEHLYVKLPRGFSAVTRLQIAIVLIQGIAFVLVPSQASTWGLALPQLKEISWETAMVIRLVGVPLLAMSYILFNSLRVCEIYKSQAKTSLVGIAACNGLMFLMSAWSGAASGILFAKKTLIALGVRLGLTALPLAYVQALYCVNTHGGVARRSASFSKDCGSPSFLTKTPPAVITSIDQNKPTPLADQEVPVDATALHVSGPPKEKKNQ